jgi:hypothetical protein
MQKNHDISFLGRVVDQQKHAPISGAKVSLNIPGAPPLIYTDLEGIYRFTIKSKNMSSLQGQLTIEAKGYRSYHSFIKLLPDNRDLGDIRLLSTNPEIKTSTKSTEIPADSSIMALILLTIMAGLIIIVAVATQPKPAQDMYQPTPVETQRNPNKPHRKHKSYRLNNTTFLLLGYLCILAAY